MTSKFNYWPLIVIFLVGVILPSNLQALPRQVVNLILNEQYDQALAEINSLPESDEKLFGKAIVAFRQENYDRATKLFRRLQEEYPESYRVTDTLYYRDLIKMKRKKPKSPPVRVRLATGQSISGTLTGTATARSGSGKRLAELGPGEKWILETNTNGQLLFDVADDNREPTAAGQVTLVPGSESGKLAYAETRYRGRFEFQVTSESTVILINELPAKQYLYGVVRKEIAPNWPIETVKAQAVAARSFVIAQLRDSDGAFDVKSSHLSQVYGGFEAETPRIRRAVNTTAGEVLTYEGKVVPAYFHANSGGYIETAHSVWNQSRTPYIVPKPDTWSEDTNHSQWSASFSLEKLTQSLRESSLPAPSETLNIAIEEELPSGRAKQLSYLKQSGSRVNVGANDFRLAVGAGEIKSTWFTSIEESYTDVSFQGRGWGHGVGMSQWGARAMAKAGLSHQEILTFYYGNAQIMGRYGLGSIRRKTINE
jgi:stage II sporulation protein D